MENIDQNILMDIRHLQMTFDNIEISSDSNFSIQKQKGYLITGPYDSANVRLLSILGGIFPPEPAPGCKCNILYKGTDLYTSKEKTIKEIKKHIAFIFCEGAMISNLSIIENLLLPVSYHFPNYDRTLVLDKIKDDLKYLNIPDILDKRPAEISFYDRKKLSFIRAALMNPELVLVDKPFFNLDDYDRDKTVLYLDKLKKNGSTLIIVSHYLSIIKPLIDEKIILEKGNLVFQKLTGLNEESNEL